MRRPIPTDAARAGAARPAAEESAPRFGIGLAAIAGAALALRLLAAVRPLDVVDRWFIPDDTYYVLAIARSLAEGLGPSVNGVVLTSGFQPLIAFLLVPVFALTSSLEAPIRSALVLLGACDAANAALVGLLARRWVGPAAGLLAAGLWAISPVALDNALGGLETALALTAVLGVTALWTAHRERPTARSALLLGGAIGLALLARVDTVFLVVLLGLVELFGRERRYLGLIVPAAAAVVAPWWGYCLLRFGSVVPDSGSAAREVAHAYQGEFLNPFTETLWATWTLIGPPFAELRELRLFAYTLIDSRPGQAWVACAAGVLLLAALWVGASARIARSLDAAGRGPFLAFVVHGLLIAAFYAYYVPVLWFFRRYTAPTALVTTVLISAGVTWAWARRRRLLAKLALGLAAVATLAALAQSGERLLADFEIETAHAVDGPTGYRAPTVELLARLPPGATVAGLQSGATSYFAPGGVTVHNLDGVVDREAARAFRDREIGRLLRARGVTHFLDWRLQHDLALERAGAASFSLEPVATASSAQHSKHRLILSEVRW